MKNSLIHLSHCSITEPGLWQISVKHHQVRAGCPLACSLRFFQLTFLLVLPPQPLSELFSVFQPFSNVCFTEYNRRSLHTGFILKKFIVYLSRSPEVVCSDINRCQLSYLSTFTPCLCHDCTFVRMIQEQVEWEAPLFLQNGQPARVTCLHQTADYQYMPFISGFHLIVFSNHWASVLTGSFKTYSAFGSKCCQIVLKHKEVGSY